MRVELTRKALVRLLVLEAVLLLVLAVWIRSYFSTPPVPDPVMVVPPALDASGGIGAPSDLAAPSLPVAQPVAGHTRGSETSVHLRAIRPRSDGEDAKDRFLPSVSGRIVDINGRPLSGVHIATNAIYSTTTDASGYFTLTRLLPGAYTLTPDQARTIFVPAARAVNLPQDATPQVFGVQPDLGFRPHLDGFRFNNPGTASVDCSAFRRSYDGLDIKCVNGQPQKQYLGFFERFQYAFRQGICTGMSAASLAYFMGLLPRPAAASSTFDLTYQQAWADVSALHGRQYSQMVVNTVSPDLNAWNTTDQGVISQRIDRVYRQLRLALQPDNHNPALLDLFPRPGCSGPAHTVLPYRLDESDPQHPRVYVYENFAAGDDDKYIEFDFSNPVHSFKYWQWDSTRCAALVVIPLSSFLTRDDPAYYMRPDDFPPPTGAR